MNGIPAGKISLTFAATGALPRTAMAVKMSREATKHTFVAGENIQWLHGLSIRVATVLEVEEDRIFVSGMCTNYWIKKKTIEKTLNGHPKVMSQSW